MKKDRTKPTTRKHHSYRETRDPAPGPALTKVLFEARRDLRSLFAASGLKILAEMLEADRVQLCGPAGKPQPGRTAYRHGRTQGELTYGGRKVLLTRPRVRGTNKREVPLPTWSAYQDEDPLSDHILRQMVSGISTRGYAPGLEPMEEGIRTTGTSKSSVSRQFVARTQADADKFLHRSLEGLDLPIVLLDGIHFGDELVIVALGIDTSGRKHVLGATHGTTESEEVCRGLLRELIERGLVVERSRMFVIDGGRGLRKAIRTVFGTWAVVQRCRVHKMRNVVEHLPERKRAWVRAAMRRAWESRSSDQAMMQLRQLSRQMEEAYPSAARSVLEGAEETLTVIDLGLTGWLLKTLSSTNAIENLQGSQKRMARNVKRWRGGKMVLRWVGVALLEAEKKFRRVKGYVGMPAMLRALDERVKITMDSKRQVA